MHICASREIEGHLAKIFSLSMNAGRNYSNVMSIESLSGASTSGWSDKPLAGDL